MAPMMPVRVLHVITGLGTGGAERMLVRLLAATDRQRFQPIVISLIDEGTQGEHIRDMDVPLYTLGMQRGRPSLAALRSLNRLVRELRVDVVHGWMYHAALAVTLVSRLRPAVIGIHHSLHEFSREKSGTRLVVRALRWSSLRADKIVYCSTASWKQHVDFGYPGVKSTVIPNGFDCDAFYPRAEEREGVRKSLGLKQDDFIVFNLGRYHPVKDHKNFLMAASLLIRSYQNARFVLAGPGIDAGNTELVSAIAELGLEPYFRLLGERQDICELMNGADVFSSSSWGEAFPMTLGEAMACGVPCVATNAGDSAAIIGDTGYVVPVRDPEALAQAWGEMLKLGAAGRAKLGQAARQRVLTHFSLQSVAEAYQGLYEQLIGSRTS